MQKQIRQQPRPWWRTALAFMAIVAVTVVASVPYSTHAAITNSLHNGNFEAGFYTQPGCGSEGYEGQVGNGWNCFTNGRAARYGFYADAWAPVVSEGQYSQLIEINTWGVPNADNDRYAGIYQTLPVMPGAEYELSLRGMIRTTNMQGDLWRYQVQVGHLYGHNTDWRDVRNWQDVGWYTYYPRTEPGAFSEYKTVIKPGKGTDRLTIFVRVWKKWGITDEEINVNLDSITLVNLGVQKPKMR